MRNLNREAWFLYTVTSLEWFEQAAQVCDAFADTFNQMLTGHGLHGVARLDYWVQRYVDYGKRIRSCIELIRLADDYIPMLEVCTATQSDYRGMVEQPMGWMTEEQKKLWEQAFNRISIFCGASKQALQNNAYAGAEWKELRQFPSSRKQELNDRDDGYIGDLTDVIALLQDNGVLSVPNILPNYRVESSQTCKAGERCLWTGVWIPEQGLENYSLAFAVKGRPMQPAYEIVEMKAMADGLEYPTTKARDTTWYAVVPQEAILSSPTHSRRNVPGGQPCPREGWWSTPAQVDSRRYFKQGEVMPRFQSDYGDTIWYWERTQAPLAGE